ncbi:MAG: tetratricopeptide repeat protein [Chitinivibrionales bacterium]|nr:tetratricopeptide repeat protein [Chitinivibrionales bacterium]
MSWHRYDILQNGLRQRPRLLCPRSSAQDKEQTMKRMKYSAALLQLSLCAAILIRCAATTPPAPGETMLPEIDVIQVKENSDEALRLAQESKLEVEVVNTKLTELDNKLVMLNDEISSVSLAKIEELENRLSLLIEAYKDLQAQINALEVMPRVRVNKDKSPRKAGPPSFSPSAASAVLPTTPEYNAYESARNAYNAGNIKLSLKLFNEVLAQYPSGKYVDNCHYWIGECHYASGDYAKAIVAFKKVRTFQGSSKSDDAQFKLGRTYYQMGQKASAKKELQKLIDRYPGSEYVKRAKKFLAQMD